MTGTRLTWQWDFNTGAARPDDGRMDLHLAALDADWAGLPNDPLVFDVGTVNAGAQTASVRISANGNNATPTTVSYASGTWVCRLELEVGAHWAFPSGAVQPAMLARGYVNNTLVGQVTLDNPGVTNGVEWGVWRGIKVKHDRPTYGGSPSANCGYILHGPWDSDLSGGDLSAITGGGATAWRPLRPPLAGGLLRLADGTELVARPDPDTGDTYLDGVGVWRRTSPEAAWSKVRCADYAADNALQGPAHCALAAWEPFAVLLDSGFWSGDSGATWSSTAPTAGTPAAVLRDLLGGDQALRPSGLRQLHTAQILGASTGKLRVSGLTQAADGTALTWTNADQVLASPTELYNTPTGWLWQRGDGRIVVEALVEDGVLTFTSADPFGSGAWSVEAGTVAWTAGTGLLVNSAHWRGRDGMHAVAGWQQGDGQVNVLWGSGLGAAWDGQTIADEATAVQPYLVERMDGLWECGWLVAGTWTRYTAPWPGGTWTVA